MIEEKMEHLYDLRVKRPSFKWMSGRLIIWLTH